jgi:cell division protein FtsB
MRLKASEGERKRLGLLVITGLGFFAVMILLKNFVVLSQSGGRVGKVQTEVEAIKRENQRLNQSVSRLGSADYEEKLIRDSLGLVKPDETVVIVPEGAVKPLEPKQVDEVFTAKPNWKKWLELFL